MAAFLLLYVLVQIGIAAWAARGTSDDQDFLIAGRSLGVWQIGFSVFATWFAAETVIATSAEVASDGMAGSRIEPFGYSLGLVALALLVAHRLRAGGHMTLASFLGSRFGPQVEVVAAIFIAMGSTVWAAAQLSALAVILAEATGMAIPTMLVVSTGIVMIYAWVGGLKGDVITDVLQGGVIILALLVMLFLVIKFAGGIVPAFSAVPEEAWAMRKPEETWLQRIELWSLPILGTLASQEVIARSLGAKSPEVARKGTLLGAFLFLGAGMIPVILGLLGPALGLSTSGGDSYFTSLARTVLPAWMYVVISGAMISAILSSVDSALLSVSAVATRNGLVKLRPSSSGRERLIMARGAAAVAALVSMLIAFFGDSIRAIVLTGEGVTGLLVLPLLAGLALKKGGGVAVLCALAAAFVLTWLLDWTLGVSGAFLFALAGGAVVLAIGLTVERAFRR